MIEQVQCLYLYYFDHLEVLSAPDLEGGAGESVAGDEVVGVAGEGVDLTQLHTTREKLLHHKRSTADPLEDVEAAGEAGDEDHVPADLDPGYLPAVRVAVEEE